MDRWAFVRRYMRKGNVSTLDAGAGNGAFTIMAAAHGNRCLGLSFDEREMVDAASRAALVGASRATFMVADLRQLGALVHRLGGFDQIMCLEVVEHIMDDATLVRALYDLTNPGGQLLLTTPSSDHRAMHGERISASEDGGHVRWGYSTQELHALVESAGFQVIVDGRLSGLVSQRLTALMRRIQGLHPALGWVVVLPLRPLGLLDAVATRVARYPHLCVSVVAVRPINASVAGH
jgi:SAM-dependent methyltransferase